ncbi:hypothetical protein ZWY2020_039379 [Hordeum vulgare]|nr:hypothetical protein ZWY2020_039379 [Hordeum vulgare]
MAASFDLSHLFPFDISHITKARNRQQNRLCSLSSSSPKFPLRLLTFVPPSERPLLSCIHPPLSAFLRASVGQQSVPPWAPGWSGSLGGFLDFLDLSALYSSSCS